MNVNYNFLYLETDERFHSTLRNHNSLVSTSGYFGGVSDSMCDTLPRCNNNMANITTNTIFSQSALGTADVFSQNGSSGLMNSSSMNLVSCSSHLPDLIHDSTLTTMSNGITMTNGNTISRGVTMSDGAIPDSMDDSIQFVMNTNRTSGVFQSTTNSGFQDAMNHNFPATNGGFQDVANDSNQNATNDSFQGTTDCLQDPRSSGSLQHATNSGTANNGFQDAADSGFHNSSFQDATNSCFQLNNGGLQDATNSVLGVQNAVNSEAKLNNGLQDAMNSGLHKAMNSTLQDPINSGFQDTLNSEISGIQNVFTGGIQSTTSDGVQVITPARTMMNCDLQETMNNDHLNFQSPNQYYSVSDTQNYNDVPQVNYVPCSMDTQTHSFDSVPSYIHISDASESAIVYESGGQTYSSDSSVSHSVMQSDSTNYYMGSTDVNLPNNTNSDHFPRQYMTSESPASSNVQGVPISDMQQTGQYHQIQLSTCPIGNNEELSQREEMESVGIDIGIQCELGPETLQALLEEEASVCEEGEDQAENTSCE